MLRRHAGKTIKVQPFKWDPSPTTLDFSGLQPTDTIFIVGHGNNKGLYPMGPDAAKGSDRFL